MENYETPCSYQPCEKSEFVEIDDILIDIANHKYENLAPVFDDQNSFYVNKQIYKFKKFGINNKTKIEFELYNKHKYYVLVIDELEIQNGSLVDKEIVFKWFEDNIDALHLDMGGAKGADASPPKGAGAHGLPGGKGKRGGTRHSPTIFLFIKALKLTSTNIEKVSFEFKLKGIPGSWGGMGGNGSNGNQGNRGKHGKQAPNPWTSCTSGRTGGTGGQPGKGGQGGNGGCGGNGPNLSILLDQEDLWKVFEKSKFDVSGADPNIDIGGERAPGWAGIPGEPGKAGAGGRGGRRAGNCGGGNSGASGLPKTKSPEWYDWHLRSGLPGTAGIDGEYDFNEFEEVYRIVFNDPDIQIVNEDDY